jgi:hypothetical protein
MMSAGSQTDNPRLLISLRRNVQSRKKSLNASMLSRLPRHAVEGVKTAGRDCWPYPYRIPDV